MKGSRFEVVKCIVVLAMLTPAVALANSHGGYTSATVTPTTVAPGGTITVEFEYTVTVTDGSSSSLWAVFFGGEPGQVPYDSNGVLLAEVLPSTPGNDEYTFTVSEIVQIPEDAELGQYPINIFSCAASYQPVSNFAWYVTGEGLPITITVEEEPDDPVVLLGELAVDVYELNLQNGIENSLDAKLDSALNALDDANENNDVAAINSLGAFINAVEAQSGSKIPVEDADILIAAAQDIIDLLSGG